MSDVIIVALISAGVSIMSVIINNWTTSRQFSRASEKSKADLDAKQNEILIEALKCSIQGVYAMYREQHSMPHVVWEGICHMYDKYVLLGGNTYIKQLVHEMRDFDHV